MTNIRTIKLNNTESTTVLFLSAVLVISVFLYIYFIFNATISVSKMKYLSENMSAKRSIVSGLEAKYFSETTKIDIRQAVDLGFIESDKVLFATKKALVQNTSTFDNEI